MAGSYSMQFCLNMPESSKAAISFPAAMNEIVYCNTSSPAMIMIYSNFSDSNRCVWYLS